MLIWGSKGRERKVGEGRFYCPICQRRCQYHRKRLGRYFTLYFIPLFETKKYGEFVECQVCGTPFKPEILEYSSQALKEEKKFEKQRIELLNNLRNELKAGTPVQLVMSGLQESGLSEDDTKIILYTATDGKLKICNQCDFLYIDTLNFCSNCGGILSKVQGLG